MRLIHDAKYDLGLVPVHRGDLRPKICELLVCRTPLPEQNG